MTEIKVFKLNENVAYNSQELKKVFDDNKQQITFKNYHKETIINNFVFLEQNKTINIKGYPYGYLKTNVKYSLLSNNYGDTLVFQSQNPKTKVWNKPKKSNYSPIKFIIINSKGHINTISLDYNDGESKIKAFECFIPFMSDKQKKIYSKICGYNEVMKNVKFEVKQRYFKHRETGEVLKVPIFDLNKVDECDENGVLIDVEKTKKEEEEKENLLNKWIALESQKKFKEL